MTRIVAVAPDPRRPGAVRIQGDGGALGTVAEEDASALGVVAGAVVQGGQREALDQAADTEAAYRMALRALERRPFASPDLGRRLIRKGHPRPAVERAVARLQAGGLLDDVAFARGYVDTRAARGRGPMRIRRDLLAMGLPDVLVQAALASVAASEEQGLERVRTLAAKRARQMADLPRPTQRRRLLAFLARRGYGGPAALQIVSQVVR